MTEQTLALPSIWLGAFRDQAGYKRAAASLPGCVGLLAEIDDAMMASNRRFGRTGYCAVCRRVTTMAFSWRYVTATPEFGLLPAWTEIGSCEKCKLNSRMRATYDALSRIPGREGMSAYVAERATPAFRHIRKLFGSLAGSEFMGDHRAPGQAVLRPKRVPIVRHEDMTRLSFADASLDVVITQDVLEHIPEYRAALRECTRVLKPGGRFVSTTPFFPEMLTTRIRTVAGPDGGMMHHHPAIYHGNPMSAGGSLCFQDFGWDLLDDMADAGLSEVSAELYWGPWQGHFGFPQFILTARRH